MKMQTAVELSTAALHAEIDHDVLTIAASHSLNLKTTLEKSADRPQTGF